MSIDTLVQNFFITHRSAGLVSFFSFISDIFDANSTFFFLVLVVGLVVYFLHGSRYVWLYVLSLFATGIIVYFIKLFTNIDRPMGGVVSAFGQSFPSYHAAIVTVFFVIIGFIFNDYFTRSLKHIFNVFCGLAIVLVAFSRVYLGVHWLSDVLAGLFLGGVLSYIYIILFHKYTNE